ncbi:MAG: RDD family protein [Coleofasciculus sp. Co-bin14]|nr:RDD family protein [Coleofasciculus sp. Co-bin14]
MTQYASFGKRFLAAFLDGIIISIINILVTFVLRAILGKSGVNVANLLGIVVAWLYYAIQESSVKQATLGKQALGIVVTDLQGKRIDFVKATIRYFSKIISSLILLIGYIMAAFTEKKQALHDMIAGTLVLNK